MLLRLADVPTRFVKGLSVGPNTDAGGGLHVVRERDAHAWIEVWLPESGWVEQDPTPPAQFADAHPRAPRLEQLAQQARAALASAWAFVTARGPIAFLRKLATDAGRLAARLAREPIAWLVVASLVLAPSLVRWWRARRRRRPTASRDEALRSPRSCATSCSSWSAAGARGDTRARWGEGFSSTPPAPRRPWAMRGRGSSGATTPPATAVNRSQPTSCPRYARRCVRRLIREWRCQTLSPPFQIHTDSELRCPRLGLRFAPL